MHRICPAGYSSDEDESDEDLVRNQISYVLQLIVLHVQHYGHTSTPVAEKTVDEKQEKENKVYSAISRGDLEELVHFLNDGEYFTINGYFHFILLNNNRVNRTGIGIICYILRSFYLFQTTRSFHFVPINVLNKNRK